MVGVAFLNQATDFFNIAGTMLLYMSPIILLIIFLVYQHLQKRYPVDAIIYEQRDNNIVKTNDRMGRFLDQGIWKYKFKKTKDTLPIVNHDWIIHTIKKPMNIFESIGNFVSGGTLGTIEFFKYGSKQYKPIRMDTPQGMSIHYQELKDKKTGDTFYTEVYTQINPHKRFAEPHFEIIDWDNINFMIQEQRATDERRKAKQTWLQQYGVPLIMIGCATVAIIFSFYFGTGIIQQSWATAQSNKGGGTPAPAVEHATGTEIPIMGNIINGAQG